MVLDKFIFILWSFLLTEIMRKTLDPSPGPKASLDGNIGRGVENNNEQSQQQEIKVLGNFQPKELTKTWERIEIDQDCEGAQCQEGSEEKDI